MDVNYLPLTDMRIARTFCFTNEGQALYLSSPTEIQRITYSQEMCDNLQVSTVLLCIGIYFLVGESTGAVKELYPLFMPLLKLGADGGIRRQMSLWLYMVQTSKD